MAIQMQTSLEVADNSGARRVEMIMPIGGSTGKIASLGDRIKVKVIKIDGERRRRSVEIFVAPQQPHEIRGARDLQEHFKVWESFSRKAAKAQS